MSKSKLYMRRKTDRIISCISERWETGRVSISLEIIAENERDRYVVASFFDGKIHPSRLNNIVICYTFER